MCTKKGGWIVSVQQVLLAWLVRKIQKFLQFMKVRFSHTAANQLTKSAENRELK